MDTTKSAENIPVEHQDDAVLLQQYFEKNISKIREGEHDSDYLIIYE